MDDINRVTIKNNIAVENYIAKVLLVGNLIYRLNVRGSEKKGTKVKVSEANSRNVLSKIPDLI